MKKVAMICLALVLVFAMGVVAFAEAGVGTDGGFTSNSATTDITVEVNTGNISATVPTTMTVVANASGGELTAPTGYRIINKSQFAIKVDAQVTNILDGWTLSNSALSGSDLTADDIGDIYMTFTPEGGSAWTLSETATTSGGFISSIAAASTLDGTTKNIAVAGSSSKLKVPTTSTNAITVTYTIAVAS